MKNPLSDPAPGASSSQGSEEAIAGTKGRDVAGVETAGAWTGQKKTKIQSPHTSMVLGKTARDGSEQADINNELEERLRQIEGFDWDADMLKEEIDSFRKRYYALPDDDDFEAWIPMSDEQLKDMQLRFAICRLKAHKMSEGHDLSIAELRNMYPPSVLEEQGYFRRLERHFEWYFDPKYFEFANLEDYQKLALRSTIEYKDWEFYHKSCSTLQSDREYVYFWEELSSRTKLIKNFRITKPSEREKIEQVVFYHAVKIAGECTHCFTPLIHNGYSEYLWSVWFYNAVYEEYARLYFDIWKLVAKQKVSFKDAVDQVKEKGMRSLCCFELNIELDCRSRRLIGPVTKHYYTHVAEINENVPEDKAYEMVLEAAKKFVRKTKTYYDYAKKKLDIAEKIGLIYPSSSSAQQNSSEVTA